MDLVKKSIEIIKRNQSESGAFIASPNLEVYNYSWFRDGSWVAYSLLVTGETKSADMFYDWGSKIILDRKKMIEKTIFKHKKGISLSKEDVIRARYNWDGTEVEGDWGDFQTDGLGVFLWCLSKHMFYTKNMKESWISSASLICDYLIELWNIPCCDIWESNCDKIHTSTLASIYGGLHSFLDIFPEKNLEEVCKKIRDFILENCICEGFFVRYAGSQDVDSSLIMLSIPFNLFSPDDATIERTINKIIKDLKGTNGLRRCPDDDFYGGGEWIILGSWLGLYYLSIGKVSESRDIVDWIEKQADQSNFLPEQVNPADNIKYHEWIEKWGKPANPLLWSHAMYIILKESIAGNTNFYN